jgi:hypothetical protein
VTIEDEVGEATTAASGVVDGETAASDVGVATT